MTSRLPLTNSSGFFTESNSTFSPEAAMPAGNP
jgi:hypothetical protein